MTFGPCLFFPFNFRGKLVKRRLIPRVIPPARPRAARAAARGYSPLLKYRYRLWARALHRLHYRQ